MLYRGLKVLASEAIEYDIGVLYVLSSFPSEKWKQTLEGIRQGYVCVCVC